MAYPKGPAVKNKEQDGRRGNSRNHSTAELPHASLGHTSSQEDLLNPLLLNVKYVYFSTPRPGDGDSLPKSAQSQVPKGYVRM